MTETQLTNAIFASIGTNLPPPICRWLEIMMVGISFTTMRSGRYQIPDPRPLWHWDTFKLSARTFCQHEYL